MDLNTQDFPWFAFRHDFKRPAADFAIRGKSLRGDAGIHRHREGLAAEGALDVREFFHAATYPASGESQTRICGDQKDPLKSRAAGVHDRTCLRSIWITGLKN